VEVLLVIVIVAAVAIFVTVPLRRSDSSAPPATEDPRRAELEARKEALYRQIRDAELDREQGKLSREDWARADAELRAQAMEVLREIDSL
jgi:hypothetical protein